MRMFATGRSLQLWPALLAIVSLSCATGCGKVDPRALWLPSGATVTNPPQLQQDGGSTMRFELPTPDLQAIVEDLKRHYGRPAWRELVWPNQPVGWESFLNGDAEVSSWQDQWINTRGQIVAYHLRASRPDTETAWRLEGFATHQPRRMTFVANDWFGWSCEMRVSYATGTFWCRKAESNTSQ